MGEVEFTGVRIDENLGFSFGLTMQVYTNLIKKMHGHTEV